MQPGATLSHYQVLERIGRGGMGTVYRARDTRLGRDVAIKVINAEIASDADRLARFRREATIVAALNHPAIVVIHDTGHEAGTSYLVTEFVDGVSLRTLLRDEGALGYRRVIDIGAQIADALGAVHALGIMHRDLKPENVMLTRQGRAKLLDFGLAKSREVDAGQDVTRTVLNTEVGVVMGTVGYMSPEQVRGEALDARSDIFSLGIVLYEMLSGARPFEGATTADVVSAVLRAEPPPLSDSVPASLRTIVQRCLNSQPVERFQSAADLAFALRSVTGGTAVVAPVRGRRSARFFLPLAAVVVAVGGGLTASVVYWNSAESGRATGLRLRPSATEAHGEAQPIWSPDGRSMAYIAMIDGTHNIFVKRVNTPGATHVLRCPSICDAVNWSADGSRILYHSRTTHLDARLWSVAPTGGGPSLVFKDDVQALASAVSPDGKRLAVLRVIKNPAGPGQMYGLFLSEPPGAEPVRFEPFPLLNLITPTRITWAADSTRLLVFSAGARQITFVSLADQSIRQMPVEGRVDMSWGVDPRFAVVARPSPTAARSGLEWFDTETGRLSPLMSSESALSSPAVSPDGSSVAYTVGDTDFDLVEIPLDGSPIRPLLASRLPEHSVHSSPRSEEFAYTAAGEDAEIRIRQPATLAERVVVSRSDFPDQSGPSRFVAAAFSPDGTKLAYNRDFTIWISPSNGGAPTKLTRESGEFAAEWSPDGSWIAFNYARPFYSGLVKVRVGAGEPEVRLRQGVCGPAAPAWSPDGAWIACGREPMGLELVPANGGPARPLGMQYEPVAVWSRDSNRLYVIRALEGRRELGELAWRSGVFRPISRIPSDFLISNGMSWAGRLSLSHDGKSLVTAVSRATGDIWILEGLHPPQTWWKRLMGRR
jgi:eukaryotic-like serine/threonine-protein kinase